MGGAQAIAALAYGTESVEPVDVIVGPGNAYVQEAKRQVAGRSASTGSPGPSELVVVADGGRRSRAGRARPLAQAEHGEDTLVAVTSPSAALLERWAARPRGIAPERLEVSGRAARADRARRLDAAVDARRAIAPEHLELVGAEAEALAERVRAAGCVFVGRAGATAFGDYVAGSNHVLPTGGAARFRAGSR